MSLIYLCLPKFQQTFCLKIWDHLSILYWSCNSDELSNPMFLQPNLSDIFWGRYILERSCFSLLMTKSHFLYAGILVDWCTGNLMKLIPKFDGKNGFGGGFCLSHVYSPHYTTNWPNPYNISWKLLVHLQDSSSLFLPLKNTEFLRGSFSPFGQQICNCLCGRVHTLSLSGFSWLNSFWMPWELHLKHFFQPWDSKGGFETFFAFSFIFLFFMLEFIRCILLMFFQIGGTSNHTDLE